MGVYLTKNLTAYMTSFQKIVMHILKFLLHILCSKHAILSTETYGVVYVIISLIITGL